MLNQRYKDKNGSEVNLVSYTDGLEFPYTGLVLGKPYQTTLEYYSQEGKARSGADLKIPEWSFKKEVSYGDASGNTVKILSVDSDHAIGMRKDRGMEYLVIYDKSGKAVSERLPKLLKAIKRHESFPS